MSAKRDSGTYSPRDEVLLWLGAALQGIRSDRVDDNYQHVLGADGSPISLTPGRTGIHADDHWHDWHDRLLYRDATTYQAVNAWLRGMLSRHADHATVQAARQIWDACTSHGGPEWTDERNPRNGYPTRGVVAHREHADQIGRPVRFTADCDHEGRLVVDVELFEGGHLDWVGWPRTVSLASWLRDVFTGDSEEDEVGVMM